jgi:hypothetical protein
MISDRWSCARPWLRQAMPVIVVFVATTASGVILHGTR